jgi:hypothetical protein
LKARLCCMDKDRLCSRFGNDFKGYGNFWERYGLIGYSGYIQLKVTMVDVLSRGKGWVLWVKRAIIVQGYSVSLVR